MAEQAGTRAGVFILMLKINFTTVADVQPENLRIARTADTSALLHPQLLRPAIRHLRDALDRRDGTAVERAGRLLAETIGTTATVVDAVRCGRLAVEAVLLIRDDACPQPVVALLEREASQLADADSVTDVVERLLVLWRRTAEVFVTEFDSPSPLPDRIAQHLATHLRADTRLGDLARQLGYSPSHVSALIRQATGRRFGALRADLQLDRACALLRQGKSVKEAALAAGFSDPDYLGRVFRRRFGMTPTTWRQQSGAIAAPARSRLRPRRR